MSNWCRCLYAVLVLLQFLLSNKIRGAAATTMMITTTATGFRRPVFYCGIGGPPSNCLYYDMCAPTVTCDLYSVYRTQNGSCNNLAHPQWGATVTPYVRLAPAEYSDDNYELRVQTDGTPLPKVRVLQIVLFLSNSKSKLLDVRNMHVNQIGQWVTHDTTLLIPDFDGGPADCCDAYPITKNTPDVCRAVIELPSNDPVYSKRGEKCMHFMRAVTTTRNFNCTITPQIQMNQASAFLDLSQLYGHTKDTADSIRTFAGGKLKTSIINGQEYCPLRNRNGSLLCDTRENVKICFDGGDPRLNQHFGITVYQTMFTRFHNILADWLGQLYPDWSDEVIYQEVRRRAIAVHQIITYRDYLPILLGSEYTKNVGLALNPWKRTVYDPSLMPQLSIEFTAGAFRVPHNILPVSYNFLNENYKEVDSLLLNEWMQKSDPLVEGTNFDKVLRGMTQTLGRAPLPSYNYMISNFMSASSVVGYQDLLSVDIQRGRDCGIPTYNTMRNLCGLSTATSFDDLNGILLSSDVKKLEMLYATVDDVDLLVGALLEPPVPGAMVGPTAMCIITDVFFRIRYGDRFFVDVERQPGSFTKNQLRVLGKIHLGHIFCAGSEVKTLPDDIFQVLPPRASRTRNCKELLIELENSILQSVV